MIHLVEIDPDVGVWRLEVAEDQKSYVASMETLLAKAYLFRKYRTQAYWVCDEDTAVGMVLYFDCPDQDSYDLSQLFIDRRYQGHGYGKAAAALALDKMKQDGKYKKVTLCYVDGNEIAKCLFEKLGFQETSHPWDEVFMQRNL